MSFSSHGRQGAPKSCRERVAVCRGHEDGAVVRHELRHSANRARDDRPSARQGLEHDVRAALGVARQAQKIGRRQPARDIRWRTWPWHEHALTRAASLRSAVQLLS